MPEHHLDPDLARLEQHLVTLSSRVEPDPSHYARLRQELLRRHQEHRTGTTQRAVRLLRPRFSGVKRLTLVAPPALAAALALFAFLSAMGLPGNGNTQAAQAAQISQALARTVPTLTAWQVDVQHERGNSTLSLPCPTHLRSDQRLVMRDGHTYFYSAGKWFRVTAMLSGGDAECPADLQWAMAILPAHLQEKGVSILPGASIHGQTTDRVRFTTVSGSTSITSTLWVDRHTGLVLRAERVLVRDGRNVGRDIADYSYSRS